MDALRSTPAKITYAVVGGGVAGLAGYELSQFQNANQVTKDVAATVSALQSQTALPSNGMTLAPGVTVEPSFTPTPTQTVEPTVDFANCMNGVGVNCPPASGTALSPTPDNTPIAGITASPTPTESKTPLAGQTGIPLTPGLTANPSETLSPTEVAKLQSEPIGVDEIKLIQQSIPYIDGQGNAHVNSGNFMEFIRINTGNGPGIIVPKDPHIRARLEWLNIHFPTGDKTGNWQNPGDFKVEGTAGDAREYWKVLELWGPGSTQEGEWKTMMFPGQSIEAGANTKLAGSEWSYSAVLDANYQPTSEGWTASDVLADILFSIARRANDTVISPQVQGWVNGQPTTGFLTIQDAVNAGWLAPRVPMTPAPTATP